MSVELWAFLLLNATTAGEVVYVRLDVVAAWCLRNAALCKQGPGQTKRSTTTWGRAQHPLRRVFLLLGLTEHIIERPGDPQLIHGFE